MKIFINYLKNYGETTDTGILYPKNLQQINRHIENIETEINHSVFQPKIQRIIRRIKRTRLGKYIKNIPHDIVIIPVKEVEDYDLVFNSYIYPKYIGSGTLPPNVLRINYQTDRVLTSRGLINLSYHRQSISNRWKGFDAILTTTKFSVPLIQKQCPSLTEKIYYCPNYLPNIKRISFQKFKYKTNNEMTTILFVGRDGQRKGLHELITALSKLELECKKNIDVTIISKTEFDHNLLKDIKFQHFKSASNSEVLDYMEKTHLFCLPTKSEAYGIVFLEAMSKGCAIIADNDLPRLELIKDNQCGICINPNNTFEIKDTIAQLTLNKQLKINYMENAVKTFESKFSPEVIAKKHKEIFDTVINNSKFY